MRKILFLFIFAFSFSFSADGTIYEYSDFVKNTCGAQVIFDRPAPYEGRQLNEIWKIADRDDIWSYCSMQYAEYQIVHGCCRVLKTGCEDGYKDNPDDSDGDCIPEGDCTLIPFPTQQSQYKYEEAGAFGVCPANATREQQRNADCSIDFRCRSLKDACTLKPFPNTDFGYKYINTDNAGECPSSAVEEYSVSEDCSVRYRCKISSCDVVPYPPEDSQYTYEDTNALGVCPNGNTKEQSTLENCNTIYRCKIPKDANTCEYKPFPAMQPSYHYRDIDLLGICDDGVKEVEILETCVKHYRCKIDMTDDDHFCKYPKVWNTESKDCVCSNGYLPSIDNPSDCVLPDINFTPDSDGNSTDGSGSGASQCKLPEVYSIKAEQCVCSNNYVRDPLTKKCVLPENLEGHCGFPYVWGTKSDGTKGCVCGKPYKEQSDGFCTPGCSDGTTFNSQTNRCDCLPNHYRIDPYLCAKQQPTRDSNNSLGDNTAGTPTDSNDTTNNNNDSSSNDTNTSYDLNVDLNPVLDRLDLINSSIDSGTQQTIDRLDTAHQSNRDQQIAMNMRLNDILINNSVGLSHINESVENNTEVLAGKFDELSDHISDLNKSTSESQLDLTAVFSDISEKYEIIKVTVNEATASVTTNITEINNIANGITPPVLTGGGSCDLSFEYNGKNIDFARSFTVAVPIMRPIIMFFLNIYFAVFLFRTSLFVFREISDKFFLVLDNLFN